MPGAPWRSYLLKPCGTPAACRRHYRKGEKPCDACRRGQALYLALHGEARARQAAR